MAAKYFVWGEGVWREIDVASGRVTGWRRRARFVFVRRGRLLVARRRPVLLALEALAAGQPSAAADGPRLSYRSKSKSHTKHNQETPAVPAVPAAPPALPLVLPACEHHPCCAHTVHRCNNNDKRPVGMRDIATQCAPGLAFNIKQKPTTIATATAASDYSSAEEFVTTSGRRPLAAHTKTEVNELFGKTPATKPPAAAANMKHSPVTKHAADKSGDERRERARNRARTGVNDNTDSMSADESVPRSASSDRQSPVACKELIISDADVELLRGFVSRTRPSALARFDADVGYKRKLFHAINPLVHVERCARLERLLRTKRRARPRVERGASADTDKENKDRHPSPNKVREPVSGIKKSPEKRPAPTPPTRASATRLGVSERSNKLEKEVAMIKVPKINSVASDPPRAKPERSKKKAAVARDAGDSTAPDSYTVRVPPGTHVISKRASQPTAKEYSNLEDHAIVAWLSSGSRACLVSGNRVWRDLQEQYERLTGRERSWHSLRNRYLRYILPSLGALQLPPGDVSRLRAAAATGAIKTKNRLVARRHSAFQPAARGAASRRVRGASSDGTGATAADEATGPPSPKRRSLRSRPLESASKDTSNKDESGDETASKASGSKKVSKPAAGSKAGGSKANGSKASGSEESGRSPRYSDVTRRFAARRRRLPSSSSPPPPPRSPPPPPRSPSPVLAPPSRLRRLYNPKTNM